MFTCWLLCAPHYNRFCRFSSEQGKYDLCPHEAYGLTGKVYVEQIIINH